MRPRLGLLVLLLTPMCGSAALRFVFRSRGGLEFIPQHGVAVEAAMLALVVIATTVCVGARHLGLALRRPTGRDFALGGVLVAAAALLGARFSPGLGAPFEPPADLALIVLLLAATWEELLFRGGVYRLLETQAPRDIALLANALLFMLLHAVTAFVFSHTATSLPLAFALGYALASIRDRSGSVWPCILLHFAWNTLMEFASPSMQATSIEIWSAAAVIFVSAIAIDQWSSKRGIARAAAAAVLVALAATPLVVHAARQPQVGWISRAQARVEWKERLLTSARTSQRAVTSVPGFRDAPDQAIPSVSEFLVGLGGTSPRRYALTVDLSGLVEQTVLPAHAAGRFGDGDYERVAQGLASILVHARGPGMTPFQNLRTNAEALGALELMFAGAPTDSVARRQVTSLLAQALLESNSSAAPDLALALIFVGATNRETRDLLANGLSSPRANVRVNCAYVLAARFELLPMLRSVVLQILEDTLAADPTATWVPQYLPRLRAG